MIDFSTLQGLTIPEGVVTQIADASGRVIWSAKTLKIVQDFGALTFSYQSFLKYYSTSIVATASIEDISGINALMIDGDIIPLPYSFTTGDTGENLTFSNWEPGFFPTAPGEYRVIYTREINQLVIYSFTDDSGHEFAVCKV
jgi:hypothetical protein